MFPDDIFAPDPLAEIAEEKTFLPRGALVTPIQIH